MFAGGLWRSAVDLMGSPRGQPTHHQSATSNTAGESSQPPPEHVAPPAQAGAGEQCELLEQNRPAQQPRLPRTSSRSPDRFTAQWRPLDQMEPDSLRSVVKNFGLRVPYDVGEDRLIPAHVRTVTLLWPSAKKPCLLCFREKSNIWYFHIPYGSLSSCRPLVLLLSSLKVLSSEN
jgi:hypothetical protein